MVAHDMDLNIGEFPTGVYYCSCRNFVSDPDKGDQYDQAIRHLRQFVWEGKYAL